MIHGECSPAHLLTCSPAHFSWSPGFSLLEILAVVAIMAMSVTLMAPAIVNKSDQKLTERTIVSMEEIKKAVLGATSDRVKGDVRFAGYVLDMGKLPEFFYVTEEGEVVKVNEDDNISEIINNCKYPPQPRGLWTNTPKDINDDLIVSKTYWYKSLDLFRVGWHGPYLKPPSGGVVMDGWGNPFVFENDKGDFTITSLGADGKQEGEGFDRDIVYTIKKSDYMASVAGYVSPQSVSLEDDPVTVRVYYTPVTPDCELVTDCLGYMETTAKFDGYFRFDSVPVGTQRLLMVAGETTDEIGYKIAVDPGTMWLGTLGVMH